MRALDIGALARAGGIVALAALLSACSGSIVPPSLDRGPAPRAPVSRAPAGDVPVRQPVAATPLPAVAAPAVAANVATAAKAGVIAGPAISALPITQAGAERALAA